MQIAGIAGSCIVQLSGPASKSMLRQLLAMFPCDLLKVDSKVVASLEGPTFVPSQPQGEGGTRATQPPTPVVSPASMICISLLDSGMPHHSVGQRRSPTLLHKLYGAVVHHTDCARPEAGSVNHARG